MTSSPRFLAPPAAESSTQWGEEPQLAFHNAGRHDDPKTGVTLYGPIGLSNGTHRDQVHVGLIGTETGVRGARDLLDQYADGVAGDESVTPFPGCNTTTGSGAGWSSLTRPPRRSHTQRVARGRRNKEVTRTIRGCSRSAR